MSVLLVALCASLAGCVELAVGSAVVGTLAAADRRTLGAQTEDAAINLKAESRASGLVGDNGHVNVTSYNRRVLLTGEVKDETMKNMVAREIGQVEAVQGVINELEIAGASSYTSRASDSVVTTKVKTTLINTPDIYATSFKVVTERGAVYLLGRVTQREANIAVEAVRGVSGVTKVVKVFEYIGEDELRAYSPSR
ncbi:MAG TPA: BON domain-containing protein [Burkholderiaceae bacterium]